MIDLTGEMDFDHNVKFYFDSWAAQIGLHRDQAHTWTAPMFYRAGLDLMSKVGDHPKRLTKVSSLRL